MYLSAYGAMYAEHKNGAKFIKFIVPRVLSLGYDGRLGSDSHRIMAIRLVISKRAIKIRLRESAKNNGASFGSKQASDDDVTVHRCRALNGA